MVRTSLFLAALVVTVPAFAGEAPSKLKPEDHDAARARLEANSETERARKEAGAPAAARAVEKSAPAARPQKIASKRRQAFAFAPAAGAADAFECASRDVACSAGPDGARFAPLDLGVARDDLALGWTLARVAAGERTLFDRAVQGGAAPALERADTVLYRHAGGAIEERYQAIAAGFEQTFVLRDDTGLRAGADLVIEGTLDTTLAPDLVSRASERDAIAFHEGGRPAISYGEAFAIDAAGLRLALPTTVEDGTLRITVDGAWLQAAQFPVTVDPLVGSFLMVASTAYAERNSDVAYSVTSDVYLVVWELEYTADDHDIWGMLLNGDGTVAAPAFAIDEATDDSLRPSVAWSPNGDKFLVAWEDDANSILWGLNGAYDIYGSFVDLTAWTYGPSFEVYASMSTHGLARVGGEDSPNGAFVVAWTKDWANTGDYDVSTRRVNADGSKGGMVDVDTSGVTSYDTTINKVGRGPTPWLVAWTDDRYLAGDLDISAATLDNAGGVGPFFPVAIDFTPEVGPEIAGADGEWCVAYVSDLGPNSTTGLNDLDVYVQPVDAFGASGSLYWAAYDIAREYRPAIARFEGSSPAQGGAEYLVAWTSETTSPRSIMADRFDATLLAIEDDIQVSTLWDDNNAAAVARAGAALPEYLVTWQRLVGDLQIRAQRVAEVPPPVPVADFAATPLAGNTPLGVQFTDLSSGAPAQWAWDFQDDGVVDSTARNPQFTYTQAGTYSVKLTVTGPGGTDSETKAGYIVVTVSPSAPVADFGAFPPTTGTMPLTVQFADLSTNGPTAWAWDFDDDGTVDSTAQNPSFTYTAAGTYTVKLTASNQHGSDDEVKAGYIVVTTVTGGGSGTGGSTGGSSGGGIGTGVGGIGGTGGSTSGGSTTGGSGSTSPIQSGRSSGGGGGGCAFTGAAAPADAAGSLAPLLALAALLLRRRRS